MIKEIYGLIDRCINIWKENICLCIESELDKKIDIIYESGLNNIDFFQDLNFLS